MSNKKVMIVTYYWPPSGGSGVQRWLKFAKYLPQFGWTPYILTPASPSFTIKDESLIKDVPPETNVQTLPIWEPYNLFLRLSRWTGKKNIQPSDFISTGKKSGFQRFSSWIRGNLFIPDARISWVRPATRFLEGFMKTHGIETIITTGPPHSIHLIGLRLKRKNPALKWIADFRDPWSEWDLLDTLSLTKLARRRHATLEHQVLSAADHVITIAPFHVRRFEARGDRKVELITNGFDEEDFTGIKKIRTPKFTLAHVGMVDELRDPRPVMEALRELCLEDRNFSSDISVHFIGHVNSSFKDYVRSVDVLRDCTAFTDHLPHGQLLKLYSETDVQLLILAHTVIAPGNLPGKFFEYLASGNPILALGPVQGDAGEILRQTRAGEIFERTDIPGIKAFLLRTYERWKKADTEDQRNITNFTRKNLTSQLVRILNFEF